MTATEPSITIHQQAPAGPPCSFPLPNRCPGCGYTLAGVRLLQCPECGRGIVSEDAVGEARR